MKIRGEATRIAWKYFQQVRIPPEYEKFFWDHMDGVVALEKFILRILTYGDFEDIKWLYQQYPEETWDIAGRYPDIKRGVRFWLKRWHDAETLP